MSGYSSLNRSAPDKIRAWERRSRERRRAKVAEQIRSDPPPSLEPPAKPSPDYTKAEKVALARALLPTPAEDAVSYSEYVRRMQPRPKRSTSQEYENEFRRARPKVRERSGGRCEARIAERCSGRGEHVHHRKLRSQGGTNALVNLLDVCTACHGTIHANPTDSYENGLLIRSWAPETELGR